MDYGKHEKLAKQLEIDDELKVWEEEFKKGTAPAIPGCAHNHQKEIEIYEKVL